MLGRTLEGGCGSVLFWASPEADGRAGGPWLGSDQGGRERETPSLRLSHLPRPLQTCWGRAGVDFWSQLLEALSRPHLCAPRGLDGGCPSFSSLGPPQERCFL